jgi:hypothetical protein
MKRLYFSTTILREKLKSFTGRGLAAGLAEDYKDAVAV